MAKDVWERQREALAALARALVEETRGGLLGDALERLLEAASLESGAAFTFEPAQEEGSFELAAERGFDPVSEGARQEALHRATRTLAEQAAAARRIVQMNDVGAMLTKDAPAAEELAMRGLRAAAALPIHHQRQLLSVLLFLAPTPSTFSPGVLSVLQMGGHIVALAAERERRIEREVGYRADIADAASMASLGLVTSAVVHELRTPLTALLVGLQEQQQVVHEIASLGEEGKARARNLEELLYEMKAAAGQISSLVSQVGEFNATSEGLEKLDLGLLAGEAVSVVRREFTRRSIRVIEDHEPGCITSANRQAIFQVTINLLLWAADACSASSARERALTVRTRAEDVRVILSVEDTGPGIARSDLRALFEPIGTRDRKRSRAALALKVSSDVVSSHHGHIEVANLDAGGASVRVLLPRMETPERARPTRPVSPAQMRPPETPADVRRVFVVDDDELFCRTLRRALKPHEVRSAATASEAEIELLDPAYAPDLVICDLGLPGLGGDVLHARLHAKRPEAAARFVFVTGGACGKGEADYVRSSGRPTLLKPIDTRELLTLLTESRSTEGVATLRSQTPSASTAPTSPPREHRERGSS